MYKEVLERFRDNITISDAFTKAYSVINNPKYKKIICSVSGGSDSDIMADLVRKADKDYKIKYMYIDTGLKYTQRYLEFRKTL